MQFFFRFGEDFSEIYSEFSIVIAAEDFNSS